MTHRLVGPRQAAPLLARLWNFALDLVFPPRCVACGEFSTLFCESCQAGMAKAVPPRCSTCWMPGFHDPCARCRRAERAFAAVRSAFIYEGTAREAVLALKFRGVSTLSRFLASYMADRLLDWDPPVDVIVPVPLGGQRRRLRGYNQSELLAQEVARLAGLPQETKALTRRRATAPQAQQPNEEARRRNVEDAFTLGPKRADGAVLLVDDVVTTGATLDACARALIDGGAGPIFALTFARED